jgi:hypothetical protein
VYAFVVLRFVHAFFFLMAIQPFRTITWLVSAGVMITQAVVALDCSVADPSLTHLSLALHCFI